MAQLMKLSSFWYKAGDQVRNLLSSAPSGGHHLEELPASATPSQLPLQRATSQFIDEYVDEGGDRRIGVSMISETDDEDYRDGLPSRWFSWKKLWLFTGPGFLMSIAYLDPGNLEGDLQAGAHTGYRLCWVLMWSTATGFLLQTLAAKLGVATGRHLAQHCRIHYPKPARLALWIMTEIAIIGSDIQEVIGSAIAIQLLTNGVVPLWAGVLITAADSFGLLLVERLGVRHLEAVFGGLISVMAIAFGVMYFIAGVPTGQVIEGLVIPRLPRQDMTWATAVVGAIIMPHNIYLHSALVQSRKIRTNYVGRKQEAIQYYKIESAIALVVSLFINIFVLSVFAKGFYGRDLGDIGLENAGQFLGEKFGQHMKYVWAIGLLAAGQSSTMTGTYAGQFVMTGFLELRVSLWARITLTRLVAIVPTLGIALAYRNSQGTELDVLNEWLNVLNSVQLPFALVPVLTMTASSRIMGPQFRNPLTVTLLSWAVAIGIMAINVSAIYDFAMQQLPHTTLSFLLFGLFVLIYLGLIAYLAMGPDRIRGLQDYWHEKSIRDTMNHRQEPLLDGERLSNGGGNGHTAGVA